MNELITPAPHPTPGTPRPSTISISQSRITLQSTIHTTIGAEWGEEDERGGDLGDLDDEQDDCEGYDDLDG